MSNADVVRALTWVLHQEFDLAMAQNAELELADAKPVVNDLSALVEHLGNLGGDPTEVIKFKSYVDEMNAELASRPVPVKLPHTVTLADARKGFEAATAEFALWAETAAEKHSEALSAVKDIIDEGDWNDFNDFFIDAMGDFKTALAYKSVPNYGFQHETDILVSHAISEWWHDFKIPGANKNFLAVIWNQGPDYLVDTMTGLVPSSPKM